MDPSFGKWAYGLASSTIVLDLVSEHKDGLDGDAVDLE